MELFALSELNTTVVVILLDGMTVVSLIDADSVEATLLMLVDLEITRSLIEPVV